MEQTYFRSRRLNGLKLDVPAFIAFQRKLSSQFPEGHALELQIFLRNRVVTIQDFGELAHIPDAPPRVRAFDFTMEHGGSGRRLRLRTSDRIAPEISVEGPDEAWCAGTLEVMYSTLSQYRPWYSGIPANAISVVFALILVATVALSNVRESFATGGPEALAALGALLFFLTADHHILPPSVLVLRDEVGFVAKHGQWLTLLLAAVSAVALVAHVIYTIVGGK